MISPQNAKQTGDAVIREQYKNMNFENIENGITRELYLNHLPTDTIVQIQVS